MLNDDLLHLKMLPGVQLIGFFEDVALIVRARTPEDAKRRIKWAVTIIERWLREYIISL